MAGALDRARHFALVLSAYATLATRLDLAVVVHVPAQRPRVLVVNGYNLIGAELAAASSSAEAPSSAAATPIVVVITVVPARAPVIPAVIPPIVPAAVVRSRAVAEARSLGARLCSGYSRRSGWSGSGGRRRC